MKYHEKYWTIKKIIFLICGLLCIAGVSFFIFEKILTRLPNGSTKIVFFQIHRGDGFYLQTGNGKEIIWDGGDDTSFLEKLSEHRVFWDRYIDYWIITHPDSDHYYGGLEVFKQINIGTIIVTGVNKDDEKYKEIFTLAKEKGTKIIIANSSTDFELDGVQIDTLFPIEYIYGSDEKNGNNNSLVQKITVGDSSLLLTGDIEKETENKLLELGLNLSANILKVPHHGSKSSSSKSFLKAVNPQKAIFTTGTKNSFGHPHQEVIRRYNHLGISFENSKDRDVVVTLDE